MGEKASGFLGAWIVTNVHASGHRPEGDLAEAADLARTCVTLASAQGLTRADLEVEVGDLDEHMRRALNLAQRASDVAHGRRP